jgi:hypothetical protein
MSSILEKPDRSARKQQKPILSAPTAPPGEKVLAQFPMSFPRRGLRIERLKGGLRKIDL